jgi:hypothetical protein
MSPQKEGIIVATFLIRNEGVERSQEGTYVK